jgi:predicted SAM-dependent methyltransferase
MSSGKQITKQIARPLLEPLLARLHSLSARIDIVSSRIDGLERRDASSQSQTAGRLAAIDPRIRDLERRLATSEQAVNQTLEALTAQNAVARASRRELVSLTETSRGFQEIARGFQETVGRMERRLEFIRREVMIEARYGGDPGVGTEVEPRVLNPSKLQEGLIRVNLGCGHIPLEGYVNVDERDLPGVDVVAEVGALPFDPDSIDEIRSEHLLEHFPPPRLRQLLHYWHQLLRPGGILSAVVPDAESMLYGYSKGEIPWTDLKEVTFGGQEYSGDFHFTMFSQDDIREVLQSAGFSDVKVVESGRRNGACLEMEIVASKPADSGVG